MRTSAKRRNVALLLSVLILGPFQGCVCSDNNSIVARAVRQTQFAPNAKATALVLDRQQIGEIAVTIALDPSSGILNLLNLIDTNVVPAANGQDFDFVMFVVDSSVTDMIPVDLAALQPIHYRGIRALDDGIGVVDPGVPKAGPPTLRGYLFLTDPAQIVVGPSLHEFGHGWGVYLTGPPELVAAINPSDVETLTVNTPRNNNHWNNALVDGIMIGGREDFTPCRDGLDFSVNVAPILADTNRLPFAPIELYLMGLADPTEVPPFEIHPTGLPTAIRDGQPVCLDDDGDPLSAVALDELMTTVTIEDVIRFNGRRDTAMVQTPMNFRVALVVLATAELTDEKWEVYERAVDFFSAPEPRSLRDSFPAELYDQFNTQVVSLEDEDPNHPFLNFFMATGGRATVEFITLSSER
jgi:hypothetical protein